MNKINVKKHVKMKILLGAEIEAKGIFQTKSFGVLRRSGVKRVSGAKSSRVKSQIFVGNT